MAVPSRLATAAGAVVLALPSCGSGGDDVSGTASSEPTAVTTTVPTSPSSGPPAADGCRTVGDPATGDLVDGPVRADIDGDGEPDEVAVHVAGPAIEVELSFAASGLATVRFSDASVQSEAAVRVERIADVDGDGDEDLWLVVGAGASTEVVALVLGDGCGLRRPTAEGVPNQFAVGASVGAISGIECTDTDGDRFLDGFSEHRGDRVAESTYRGTTTAWTIAEDGSSLVRGESEPFEVDLTTGDQSRYAGLSCA